jgi:hypothetical protein
MIFQMKKLVPLFTTFEQANKHSLILSISNGTKKKRVCAIPRAPDGSAFFNW